jgi:heat shock protein HslJ
MYAGHPIGIHYKGLKMSNIVKLSLSIFTCLALLAACDSKVTEESTPVESHAAPTIEPSGVDVEPVPIVERMAFYGCDEQTYIARTVSGGAVEQLILFNGGFERRFERAVSASGVKYVSKDDDKATFWIKGKEATYNMNGKSLLCLEQAISSFLQSQEWVVEDISAKGVVDIARATLVFDADGFVSGGASCNSYRGSYTLTANHITVETIASTRMMCPPALMNQEQQFLEVLAASQSVSVSETGALKITAPAGEYILAR